MSPTILTVCTAVLACAGNAAAKQWYLRDKYDASNFFEKFNFFTSKFGTGSNTDIDPNDGHVNYLSEEQAWNQGLINVEDGEVYIGVDHTNSLLGSGHPGRPSVRLESKAEFNHGLFIARFTHLPENKCGTWPAFWTFAEPWPNAGEIDIYEGWNDNAINQPALHTGNSAELGQCKLDGAGQSSPILTANCDNTFQNPPNQWLNQGCTSADHTGPWAKEEGGVYAVEWTSNFIKLYSWSWDQVPSNVDSDEPDTDTWGAPSMYLKNSYCDIDDHFVNQRLILNIDFCGNPAGRDDIWSQSCSDVTDSNSCVDWVSKNPKEFENVFWKVKDIRYFKGTKPIATASPSASITDVSTSDISASTDVSTPIEIPTETPVTSTETPVDSATSEATSDVTSDFSSAFSTLQFTNTSTSATVSQTESGSSSISIDITSSATATGSNSDGPSNTNTATGSNPDDVSASSMASRTDGGFTATVTGTGTASASLTTSVVYTTQVHTITKCPAGVPCPEGGRVVTKTIPLYTTVCPVTATHVPTSKAELPAEEGPAPTTITEVITATYTITKCPPEVKNCPVGEVTTEVTTTTWCPGRGEGEGGHAPSAPVEQPTEIPSAGHEEQPGKDQDQEKHPEGPLGNNNGGESESTSKSFVAPPAFTPKAKTTVAVHETAAVVPQPSGLTSQIVPTASTTAAATPSAPVVTPISSTGSDEACSGQDCPVTAGAAKMSASFFAVAGALAAMMMM